MRCKPAILVDIGTAQQTCANLQKTWMNMNESYWIRGHCQRSLSCLLNIHTGHPQLDLVVQIFHERAALPWLQVPTASDRKFACAGEMLSTCFSLRLSLASLSPLTANIGWCPILALKYLVFGRYLPHPYPSRGGGRGETKPTCRIPLFFAWKPWDSDPTPQILNKPWALVRKCASMMTAAQFLEGCHPYTCAASVWYVLGSSGAKRKYLIFICLPMTWNDEEYWSLRKHDCKNGILKWNFSTTPPPQIPLLRG